VCPKYKNIKVSANDLADDYVVSEILCDVEDHNCTYESAIDLCRQLKHIKKTHRVLKAIGVVLMIVGFILMLGTAGASDLNSIPFTQIIVQATISLCVSALGLMIIKKMED
jgi:hypothetical protein